MIVYRVMTVGNQIVQGMSYVHIFALKYIVVCFSTQNFSHHAIDCDILIKNVSNAIWNCTIWLNTPTHLGLHDRVNRKCDIKRDKMSRDNRGHVVKANLAMIDVVWNCMWWPLDLLCVAQQSRVLRHTLPHTWHPGQLTDSGRGWNPQTDALCKWQVE